METELTEQDLENLKELAGLGVYEIKVYMALVQHGPNEPSKIYKLADIPQPRIYDTLKSLQSKGFILPSVGEKFYKATPPVNILSLILEKKRAKLNTEELFVEEFKRKISTISPVEIVEPKIYVTTDTDQLSTWFLQLYNEAKKEWFTTACQAKGLVSRDFETKFGHNLLERGVDCRSIAPFDVWKYLISRNQMQTSLDAGWKFACLSDVTYDSFAIADGLKLFFVLRDENQENITGLLISEEPRIGASFRTLFEYLWSLAEKNADKKNCLINNTMLDEIYKENQ